MDRMNRKYIFLADFSSDALNSALMGHLFGDLQDVKNVDIVKLKRHTPKTKFGRLFERLYYSRKINSIIHLPFHWIASGLSQYDFDDNLEYVFIFTNSALSLNDRCVWEKIKKMNNAKMVLVLLDSLDIKTKLAPLLRDAVEARNIWDAIYTYDHNDAEKYNLRYLGECYYSDIRGYIQRINGPKKDIYFSGRLKPGKEEKLYTLADYFGKNRIKSDFRLFLKRGDEEYYSEKDIREGIKVFRKPKDYLDVVQEAQDSNCVLEILQDGQQAPSLRYYEAVMFNKKFLTNNKNVTKLAFYDPRFMKNFEYVKDIDCEWVRKREKVDYKYKDEFSPKNMIKKFDREV